MRKDILKMTNMKIVELAEIRLSQNDIDTLGPDTFALLVTLQYITNPLAMKFRKNYETKRPIIIVHAMYAIASKMFRKMAIEQAIFIVQAAIAFTRWVKNMSLLPP